MKLKEHRCWRATGSERRPEEEEGEVEEEEEAVFLGEGY